MLCGTTRTRAWGQQEIPPDLKLRTSGIPAHHRIGGIILRGLFIGSLVVVTVIVSRPQNETVWSAYETPGDLVRMALGLVVCLWLLRHFFKLPREAEECRSWLYLGLAVVPFALIVALAVWLTP